jgi:hypothetical protein
VNTVQRGKDIAPHIPKSVAAQMTGIQCSYNSQAKGNEKCQHARRRIFKLQSLARKKLGFHATVARSYPAMVPSAKILFAVNATGPFFSRSRVKPSSPSSPRAACPSLTGTDGGILSSPRATAVQSIGCGPHRSTSHSQRFEHGEADEHRTSAK